MMALCASTNVANVRFERKLCYDYAKQKVKGKIRTTPVRYAPVEQHVSALFTTVATSLCRGADFKIVRSHIIGGKRQSLQDDSDRGT